MDLLKQDNVEKYYDIVLQNKYSQDFNLITTLSFNAWKITV